MAQEAAPVLLLVLARLVSSTWHEGERGVCGHGILGMAAPQCCCCWEGMEAPGYGDAGRAAVPEARGGELWVQGGMEGVLAGIQGAAETQPAPLPHTPAAGAPFPADSALPREPADVCWMEMLLSLLLLLHLVV